MAYGLTKGLWWLAARDMLTMRPESLRLLAGEVYVDVVGLDFPIEGLVVQLVDVPAHEALLSRAFRLHQVPVFPAGVPVEAFVECLGHVEHLGGGLVRVGEGRERLALHEIFDLAHAGVVVRHPDGEHLAEGPLVGEDLAAEGGSVEDDVGSLGAGVHVVAVHDHHAFEVVVLGDNLRVEREELAQAWVTARWTG